MFRCLRYLKNQTSRQLCSRNNGIVYTLSLLCMYNSASSSQLISYYSFPSKTKIYSAGNLYQLLASRQPSLFPRPLSLSTCTTYCRYTMQRISSALLIRTNAVSVVSPNIQIAFRVVIHSSKVELKCCADIAGLMSRLSGRRWMDGCKRGE